VISRRSGVDSTPAPAAPAVVVMHRKYPERA
jgi:hypothetical protein